MGSCVEPLERDGTRRDVPRKNGTGRDIINHVKRRIRAVNLSNIQKGRLREISTWVYLLVIEVQEMRRTEGHIHDCLLRATPDNNPERVVASYW